MVKLWKESVAENHPKLASSLADPAEYDNLFPGLKESETTEKYLKQERQERQPARLFPSVTLNADRNIDEEVQAAVASGKFDPTDDTPPSATDTQVRREGFAHVAGHQLLLMLYCRPKFKL